MIKQDYLIRMIQQVIAAIVEALLHHKPIQKQEWKEYDSITRQLLGFPTENLKTMNIGDILAQYDGDKERMNKIELAAIVLLKIADETESDPVLKARFRQNGTALLKYVQQHGQTYSLQREMLIEMLKMKEY